MSATDALYDAIRPVGLLRTDHQPRRRTSYDKHSAAGDLHHQFPRALANRLVGILHGCLRHHMEYNEHKAWAHRQSA
jgi:hypothetical protein